jgi:hypothetical protein
VTYFKIALCHYSEELKESTKALSENNLYQQRLELDISGI